MKMTVNNIIIFIFFVFLLQLIPACSGCSKSGIKRASVKIDKTANRDDALKEPSFVEKPQTKGKTIVSMEKENGVYRIPVSINGTEMYFIFDTGAGLISISNVEATFLYRQGKLSNDDIIGKANFMDANGDISEGIIIRLNEVTIGNRTLNNIEASVVDNAKAPLLFGQSALEKFGKISIDYEKNEITFQ